jgi:uncharacterized Tic20 family protein
MDPPLLPATLPTPAGQEKIWAILSHLSALLGVGLLLPLVVYLAMRDDSEYVAANAKEALNFHLSLLIYLLCCIPLALVIVGIFLIVILGVMALILAIVAAVKAADGGCYHYPMTLRLVK